MFDRISRRKRKPGELMLVPMIDIFTVLVTFLLMTAVFSRITIVELDLPSSASTTASEPSFRLEVIVRKEGFELTNGSALIAAVPKVDGDYDLKTLAALAQSLKRDYPDAEDASVLLEPEIAYDHLIQVMDAIRSAEVPAAEAEAMAGATAEATTAAPAAGAPPADAPQADAAKPIRVALFTDIAVGDAP
jgi:biopolymer transport protein ExbD